MMEAVLETPTRSLKEVIRDHEMLAFAMIGKKCPRCEGTTFNKAGFSNLLGKKSKRVTCRDCGYTFGVSELNDTFSRNRAARILNLDAKKLDNYIETSLQYGIFKKRDNGKYEKLPTLSRTEYYHNVPLFSHLIKSLGSTPKRSDFERSLKTFSDENLSKASKIKRDVLWRRYQEIAIEVFICEKCSFDRTCKKNHIERLGCSTVKEKTNKKTWKVDIQL